MPQGCPPLLVLTMPCLMPCLPTRSLQVETQLRDVNARFARLYGVSGAHALDLYGRTNLPKSPAPAAPEASGVARRTGKRLPISSSAQVWHAWLLVWAAAWCSVTALLAASRCSFDTDSCWGTYGGRGGEVVGRPSALG